MTTALGAYIQHRYLNPSQPEMCWKDAIPLFAPIAPRSQQFNYPYPVLDPMCNMPLYGTQGVGFIPGVGPLFNATGMGETFSWIKGFVWLGGGLGLGYLVGYLWRELRTSGPVSNRGRRRRNAGRARRPSDSGAAGKVAMARALADAGRYDESAALLYELGVADRKGDIGYAERMRWNETAGVLERAGYDLAGAFTRRGA